MFAFALLASVVAVALAGWVADRSRTITDEQRAARRRRLLDELERHGDTLGGNPDDVDLDADERYWWNR